MKIDNLSIDFYDCGSKTIWLFFPGFPGPAMPSVGTKKSLVDSFRDVLCDKKESIALVYYTGVLGSDGNFNFLQTIKDGQKVAEYFLEKGYLINIIGHSWGAIVAAGCLSRINGNILLLTPYLFIPNYKTAEQTLKTFLDEYDLFYNRNDIPQMLEGMQTIFDEYNPLTSFARAKTGKIRAIISASDEVIPAAALKQTLDNMKIIYVSLNQGHNLEVNLDFVRKVRQSISF